MSKKPVAACRMTAREKTLMIMGHVTFRDISGNYYTVRQHGRKYVVTDEHWEPRLRNEDTARIYTYLIRKAKCIDEALNILEKEKYRPSLTIAEWEKLRVKLKKAAESAASKTEPAYHEHSVSCRRCGLRMFNDRDYAETDDGIFCSTCGTEEGRWR